MKNFLVVSLIFLSVSSFGQSLNELPGNWKMTYQPWPHISAIELDLKIYQPVQNMIFPTRMKIKYGKFQGEYDFLLIKKGDKEVGIARNKIPLQENPFSLGPWTMYLNGHFEIQSEKGKKQLQLKRLWIENFGIFMAGLYDDEMQTSTKVYVRDFLYNAQISLEKVNSESIRHPNEKEMIEPKELYYGVYDPIQVTDSEIKIAVLDEERYDKDTITILHNGKIIVDKIRVGETSFLDKIILEKGDNYIAFFAENYGDLPPNTANFLVYTEGGLEPQYSFDFTAKSNAYATAMVAHFIYNPKSVTTSNPKIDKITPKIKEGRNNLKVGNLTTTSSKVSLDIWDTKKEDGDIVSIYLNDKKIVENLEVKKRNQRIEIDLKPGYNSIIFKAENLGSIPPNTAALKIIGKNLDKSIQLNTDYNRNNLIEIYFND